ncbi:MAG: hypothetical protein NT009_02675 [Proteobacteria bacterium]|nr:hypothetical protein [Pseudomonadota bacterium]
MKDFAARPKDREDLEILEKLKKRNRRKQDFILVVILSDREAVSFL